MSLLLVPSALNASRSCSILPGASPGVSEMWTP